MAIRLSLTILSCKNSSCNVKHLDTMLLSPFSTSSHLSEAFRRLRVGRGVRSVNRFFTCTTPNSCPVPLDCAQEMDSMQCCSLIHILILYFSKLLLPYCLNGECCLITKYIFDFSNLTLACLNLAQTHCSIPRKQLQIHNFT